MKNIIILISTIITLTSCSSGVSLGLGVGTSIGRHIDVGTSVSVPITKSNSNQNNNQIGKSANHPNQIATYFDLQGNTFNYPINNGIYRKIVGSIDNKIIVQDFYSDNNQKRTDPFAIENNQLHIFSAFPNNGTLTTYSFNGELLHQKTYKNARLINTSHKS